MAFLPVVEARLTDRDFYKHGDRSTKWNFFGSSLASADGGVATLICINLSVVLTQTQGAPSIAK